MKYDFQNSRYYKFFVESNAKTLVNLVNTKGLLYTNYTFFEKNFEKSRQVCSRNTDGTSIFKVTARDVIGDTLADMRAPFSNTNQVDKTGIAYYTGTIPDLSAKGVVENALERTKKEEMYKLFGSDASMVEGYVDDIQRMKNELDMTYSNWSAQLLSTGKIIHNGGLGIKGAVQKADIPAENFVKAGKLAWQDPSCELISQMSQIEEEHRMRTGYQGAMKWQITRDMFINVVLKNKQVIELVKMYNTLNDKVFLDSMAINEEMFRNAIAGSSYELSPIEIVIESQQDTDFSGNRKTIHGWKDGVAVLRPSGYAGTIEYSEFFEMGVFKKYGSSAIVKNFTPMPNGLYYLVNTTLNNGDYKEWHTDMFGSCVPALSEFPYHLIVDTKTAND